MKFCLAVARRHKLDPFRGQIWFVKRVDRTAEGGHRWIPIVGIGGMLHIAARDHKDFGSNDEPEFGPMHEVKWSYYEKSGKLQAPEWAKVTLWKKGLDHPTVAKVFWDEIYPDVGAAPLVRQMPRLMLGKCALAQALRRAYPATDGLYIKEEFQGREQFTPEGREIVYKDAPQLEEGKSDPNWQAFLNRLTPEEREKELAATAKNTPAQKEILANKLRKSSVTEAGMDPSGTLQPSKLAEAGSTPASSSKSPQENYEKPAKAEGGTAGGPVPCLFYKLFPNSGTYQITGAESLMRANRELLKPLWSPSCGAVVATPEQLGKLISQLERANVPFREIQ